MKRIIRFTADYLGYIVKGGPKFYLWIGFLSVFVAIWLFGYAQQLDKGLIVTGMSDQVSWGLYIANFIFLVGVAAGAVTVVFPSYVYKHESLHEVAVLGEMLAVFAVTLAILFVFTDMGRPDRVWHLIPFIGIYNWPNSMLAWDVMVLSVYFVLNAVTGFYFLYKRYYNSEVNKLFYMPMVYIAIVWAISIHTVTALLIGTFDTRALWHSGLMPIRFIVTAFAAGPALIIVMFLQLRKHTKLQIKDEAINLLSQIVVWCLGIALFFTLSEVITELYQGSGESMGMRFLMFGLNGLTDLVPWFWSSLALITLSFVLLLFPSIRKNYKVLPVICVMTFIGIWIEKGMGLVIPGMIPTPIGELTQYKPTFIEIFNCIGIWAFGFILLTLLVKGAAGILTGEIGSKEQSHARV